MKKRWQKQKNMLGNRFGPKMCLHFFLLNESKLRKLFVGADISTFSCSPVGRLAWPVILFAPLGSGKKLSDPCVDFWDGAVGQLRTQKSYWKSNSSVLLSTSWILQIVINFLAFLLLCGLVSNIFTMFSVIQKYAWKDVIHTVILVI